jgi:hypothetical protein
MLSAPEARNVVNGGSLEGLGLSIANEDTVEEVMLLDDEELTGARS